MIQSRPSRPESIDAGLADLIDELTVKVQAGEPLDVEEYAAAHPAYAERLRELWPALHLMADLGPATARRGNGEPVAGFLGDYRIVREVGRGGMGVVYEAEQVSLGRRVALKVLPFAATMDPRHLRRFQNEARAAASLHHEHIVPVYGVGCERGVHFYAMQFIDGRPLSELIEQLRRSPGGPATDPGDPTGEYPPAAPATPTDPVAWANTLPAFGDKPYWRRVAELGVQAAEALEYAHSMGVVHRDVKPGNLLLDGQGKLWVADFGLAKLGADAGVTMTGDLLGTLRYMSPEQALAKHGLVDHRTDVYALGATLYELLARRPAFHGQDRQELLRQIAFEEPRPPRRADPAVPAELETIVRKALAKNPRERYATAQELADDLRRFLEDKPIRAKRPSVRQWAVKWARRHTAVVRAAAAVLALAVGVLAVSSAVIWRAFERERQTAYYQRIARADQEWWANNLARMDQLLADCPEDLRGFEWHYLRQLRGRTLDPLRHDAAVLAVDVSPDGARIAAAGQDGLVTVWDAKTGRKLIEFRAHKEHARTVAFSPDGRWLVSGGWDGTVQVSDAHTGQALHHWAAHSGKVWSIAFSPDGTRLASGGEDQAESGEVKLWDAIGGWEQLAPGREQVSLSGHELRVVCVAFSPDGQRLASASHDGTVKVWDVETGREQVVFRGHSQEVWAVAFSPDGRLLASGEAWTWKPEPADIKLWDSQTGREVHTLRGHTAGVMGVAFAPDGRRLASAGQDHTVKLWDVRTGQEALTLRGHRGTNVRAVRFSPDGRRLVSGSADRTVRVWDGTPAAGEPDPDCLTLEGHGDVVSAVAFSPADDRVLASAGFDGTVRLWDAWTGKPRRTFPGGTGAIHALAFSHDGRRLATAGADKVVRVRDAMTGDEVCAPLKSGPGELLCVAFSPDGRRVAVSGSGKVVEVWDVETGRRVHALPGHTWVVHGLAFSPDGRHLASGSYDGTVQVWDVEAGKPAGSPLIHAVKVTAVAFSADGRRLASAGTDPAVKIWDTATWRTVHVLPDLPGGAWGVAFSPDGRRLAWGGTDSTVKVWDADGGEVRTFRGHTGWVQGVAFSPDGNRIASASADRMVRIWEVPPEAPARPPAGADH